MKSVVLGAALVAAMVVGGGTVLGDEASGKVTETGFGSFKLDEKGTIRQFNLAKGKTEWEPKTWQLTKGDEVTVTFNVETRRGNERLVVQKVVLVKGGPDTITDLKSPVEAEVVETGRSGVRVKISSGQIVKFAQGKKTQKVPAGWTPAAGEKVKIEFSATESRAGFGMVYEIEKIEKVGAQ